MAKKRRVTDLEIAFLFKLGWAIYAVAELLDKPATKIEEAIRRVMLRLEKEGK